MAPKFAQEPVMGAELLTDNTETTLFSGSNVSGTVVDWVRISTGSGETATSVTISARLDGSTTILIKAVDIVPDTIQRIPIGDVVLPDGWDLTVTAAGTVVGVLAGAQGAELG